MSKIKIYNGMTFNMSTSKVISHGEVRYVDSSDVVKTKGGNKTSTSTSGFATEFKPEIKALLGDANSLYGQGKLGQIAGFNADQLSAQAQGRIGAANQTALEQSLMNTANQGVDLSGMRTQASQQAQQALGMSNNAAAASGSIGSGRSRLNQSGISNNLAAQFAGIDQQAQATNFANQQAALQAQGTGAKSLAGIGSGIQQQQQNVADAPFKGISQLSSIYHGVMPKETTTVQSGGK